MIKISASINHLKTTSYEFIRKDNDKSDHKSLFELKLINKTIVKGFKSTIVGFCQLLQLQLPIYLYHSWIEC